MADFLPANVFKRSVTKAVVHLHDFRVWVQTQRDVAETVLQNLAAVEAKAVQLEGHLQVWNVFAALAYGMLQTQMDRLATEETARVLQFLDEQRNAGTASCLTPAFRELLESLWPDTDPAERLLVERYLEGNRPLVNWMRANLEFFVAPHNQNRIDRLHRREQ